jgi:hypothetical protein
MIEEFLACIGVIDAPGAFRLLQKIKNAAYEPAGGNGAGSGVRRLSPAISGSWLSETLGRSVSSTEVTEAFLVTACPRATPVPLRPGCHHRPGRPP